MADLAETHSFTLRRLAPSGQSFYTYIINMGPLYREGFNNYPDGYYCTGVYGQATVGTCNHDVQKETSEHEV